MLEQHRNWRATPPSNGHLPALLVYRPGGLLLLNDAFYLAFHLVSLLFLLQPPPRPSKRLLPSSTVDALNAILALFRILLATPGHAPCSQP